MRRYEKSRNFESGFTYHLMLILVALMPEVQRM